MGQVGSYWEYQLDSLIFDNQGETQFSRTGYLRSEIVDVNGSADGDTVYTMHLSRRSELGVSWIEDKLFRVEKSLSGDIIVTVDNLVFKEFTYPFNQGTTWENVQFDAVELAIVELVEGEELTRYLKWDESIVINRDTTLVVADNTYEDVATVQEVNNENDIDLRKSVAYYANGVGLIARERSVLHTQCFNVNPDCLFDAWEDKAYMGYITTQTLIDFAIN